jgi:hypothetical protein
MSTIYTDGAGNKYLGDCRWGNHDINYPTRNFLKSVDYTSFSADASSLLSASGLLYRNVVSQSVINGWVVNSVSGFPLYFAFGSAGDIDDRFVFGIDNLAFTYEGITLWNNNGFPGTTDLNVATSNLLGYLGYVGHDVWDSGVGYTLLNFVITASDQGLAMLWHQTNLSTGAIKTMFRFACRLQNVNQNFNYYGASESTKSFLMAHNGYSSVDLRGGHYIGNSFKQSLETGRAAYTIACSDGQTPGAQWATDMWVYDDNATLGYPVIGRVPNMLLGIGTYTYLKPVRLIGVTPDAGSPWYLPVGTFASKTLLMRCYSSMG